MDYNSQPHSTQLSIDSALKVKSVKGTSLISCMWNENIQVMQNHACQYENLSILKVL